MTTQVVLRRSQRAVSEPSTTAIPSLPAVSEPVSDSYTLSKHIDMVWKALYEQFLSLLTTSAPSQNIVIWFERPSTSSLWAFQRQLPPLRITQVVLRRSLWAFFGATRRQLQPLRTTQVVLRRSRSEESLPDSSLLRLLQPSSSTRYASGSRLALTTLKVVILHV